MMQALDCCGWQKGTSPDEATLNSEEIKPVAIAVVKLCLSEGIREAVSQSVGWLVSQSVSQSVGWSVSQSVSQSVSSKKFEGIFELGNA